MEIQTCGKMGHLEKSTIGEDARVGVNGVPQFGELYGVSWPEWRIPQQKARGLRRY